MIDCSLFLTRIACLFSVTSHLLGVEWLGAGARLLQNSWLTLIGVRVSLTFASDATSATLMSTQCNQRAMACGTRWKLSGEEMNVPDLCPTHQ